MNRDEARRCLSISRQSAADGQRERALKFARKAVSLDDELKDARAWLAALEEQQQQQQRQRQRSPSPKRRQRSPTRNDKAPPSATSSSTTGTAPEREYTQEQVVAVQRILKCRRDYYEVLEVQRSASDADLKRSYRRLALQFHPDKNAAPQASEAFKVVSAAFTTLSDGQKRADYDRFGVEGVQGAASSARQRGPAFRTRSHDFDDLAAQELFNMFFGLGGQGGGRGGAFGMHQHPLFGGMPGVGGTAAAFSMGPDGRLRFRRTGGGGPFQRRAAAAAASREEDARQTVSSWWVLICQFLPIFIILFSNVIGSLLASVFQPRMSPFQFSPDVYYSVPKQTYNRQVPYYVMPRDSAQFSYTGSSSSSYRFRQMEDEIERDFDEQVGGQCQRQRQARDERLRQAKMYGRNDDIQQAEDMPLPACDLFERYK